MAWHVHFDGDKLAAIDDKTYEQVKAGLLTAAETGSAAVIGLSTSTDTYEIIWTVGAPIYFSHFDEHADVADLDRELAGLLAG